MNTTQTLHDFGQSLWLDNITRSLLDSGTLARYIRELNITGLTSNPTIFEHAIGQSEAYDKDIARKTHEGKSGEALFFELAIDDLRRAADLFRPTFDATHGVDGWVSLEVSPLLAPIDPICTSRFQARPKARWPLRNRFLPACRSTSPCCSPAPSTRRQPRPTCAALSAALLPV